MKKSLLSILLVVFLAVISGCADTGSGGGTGNSNTPSYDISSIPEDKTPIELTKSQSGSGGMERTESKAVTITNPRTEPEQYYPILISSAMDLNGEGDLSKYGAGIIKGIGYRSYFGDKEISINEQGIVSGSNLNFPVSGEEMYNLEGAKSLDAAASGTYYILLDSWNGEIPAEGIFIIAFLTKEEAATYIPDNSNIKLTPDSPDSAPGFKPTYLDSKTVNELNQLGALRQYTFTVK